MGRIIKKLIVICGLFFICNATALAQETEFVDLERIVITASGISENIKGTTSAVTVFTRKEIEDSHVVEVKDAIKETLGTDVVQTGSFGGSTSVFLRGANPGQSKIMIDNIRVYALARI